VSFTEREAIGNFSTERVTARERLRQAGLLLNTLQFMAAGSLVEGLERPEAEWLRWLAAFWGAWDRFDYAEADRLRAEMPGGAAPGGLAGWVPTERQREFVGQMAAGVEGDFAARAEALRRRAADLIENGRRRIRLGQLEDASLRAYRALEMFGQIRLFLAGYDSAGVAVGDEAFKAFLQEKGIPAPRVNRRGEYEVSRELVARFLKYREDELGKKLCNPKEHFGYDPKFRNLSNLIHGFEAGTRTEARAGLEAAYKRLEEFFVKEEKGNGSLVELARFPFAG
jgi:hypothetical protein